MPFVTDAVGAVEFIMLVSCLLMGASHIVRPRVWVDFFTGLHRAGTSGVITRSFIEIWPALIIVTFHQVWQGVGIILTLYGWLLLAKVAIALLAPRLGLRSLAMAERGERSFIAAGVVLLAIGASSGAALWT